jgi:hypothetical protein
MSIELELRLEGQNANEETLRDLMDWLGNADIEGLTVKPKELLPVEGDMSLGFDLALIISIPPAIHAVKELLSNKRQQQENAIKQLENAIKQLCDTVSDWHKTKGDNVSITPMLKSSDELDKINKQINNILEEMRQKCRKNK